MRVVGPLEEALGLARLTTKEMLAVTWGQMFKLQHHRQIGGIEGKVKRGRAQ